MCRVGRLIQPGGVYTEQRRLSFPDAVTGMPIKSEYSRVHFLRGMAWAVRDGQHIGSYVIQCADGRRGEIPLRYGEACRNWWWSPAGALSVSLATLVWQGTNRVIEPAHKLCLLALIWNNPYPDRQVSKLDSRSIHSACCPFLIAVTVQ